MTKQWREDDIIYVENDFVRMAYVYTDDPAKIGTTGWHGPNKVYVEYVPQPLGWCQRCRQYCDIGSYPTGMLCCDCATLDARETRR